MSLDKSFSGSLNKKKTAVFVPYNGKIADITHSDTDLHTLDLAAALNESRKITAVLLTSSRQSGTGSLNAYPNEGTYFTQLSVYNQYPVFTIIKDGTQRWQYKQTVANDDFDLYCFGYVVEA